jgi:uncharacterized membrane protein YhhN
LSAICEGFFTPAFWIYLLCKMRRNPTIILSLVFLLAAVSSIAGNVSANLWLHDLATPLATILLVALAASNWRTFKKNYALWIAIGLLFSLLGDIALLRPAQYFLPGLVAFLFAHIAYLIAFTRDAKFPARFSIWLLFLCVAAALYLFLFPGLPGVLKLPVAVYAILLSSMAGQAMGRYLVLRCPAAHSAAIGALLFMFSDALLSIDRFRASLPRASLFILVPYFLGQWLIALSTCDSPGFRP